MRLSFLLGLFLLISACMQVDPETAGSGDASSLGGEGVGIVDTSPPTFRSGGGERAKVLTQYYDFSFTDSNAETLELISLRVKGRVKYLNQRTVEEYVQFDDVIPFNSSQAQPVSSANPFVYRFEKPGAQTIIITEVAILGKVENGKYYTPKAFNISIGEIEYYAAWNLTPPRFAWYPTTPSTFVTDFVVCDYPLVQDENAECVMPRKTCSDIQTQFINGKGPCAVTMDGIEIDCFATTSSTYCLSLTPNICTNYSDHLVHSEQLIQVLYNGQPIQSQVCTKRTIDQDSGSPILSPDTNVQTIDTGFRK